MSLRPLPPMGDFLMQYLHEVRRRIRPGLSGGHITLRRGQTLEFREHTVYSPGDDIRRIDWRVSSARLLTTPNPYERLLVRTFLAEERMRLVISVDTRRSMTYPKLPGKRRDALHMSKLQAARWLIEAVGFLAGEKRDSVVVHPLFGKPRAQVFSGSTASRQMRASMDALLTVYEGDDTLNMGDIERYLPSASIWIIVSDYYFDPGAVTRLADRIRRARDGQRLIVRLDLDCWKYEQKLLRDGPHLVSGPGSNDKKVNVSEPVLYDVAARIKSSKEVFIDQPQVWEWKPEWIKGGELLPGFKDWLREGRLLERIYARGR